MVRLFFVLVLLTSSVQASSITDNIKNKLKAAECALNRTETMCLIEGLLDLAPTEPVQVKTAIFGRSGKYYLVTGHANWLKAWSNAKRKEDLLLIDKDGKSFVEVHWLSGQQVDFKKLAGDKLKTIADTIKSKPNVVPVNFWPYSKNGIIYNICYETKLKTQECMFSAAANLPEGTVAFFATTQMRKDIVNNISQLIASLDIVKE